MQVTQMAGGVPGKGASKPTNQEMQNEYNFFLAEQLTQKLLAVGLITRDEFEKLGAKNRQTFSPFISKIIS